MQIRQAEPRDIAALADIFFDAVRIGAAPAYSTAQLAAWAPQRPSVQAWAERLTGLYTLVADQEGPQGFMSLRMGDGYLDFAFVRPERRGTGLAGQMYDALESHARNEGLVRLHSHASHMAKPFFQRFGWQVLVANSVTRGDQVLDNWLMEKPLG